jgi:septum formation protein
VADALAEAKARKVSLRRPGSLVLGCDQVLALEGRVFSKAQTADQGLSQLQELRGKTHHLFSAAVLYEGGEPIWRHVGQVRMTMRMASDAFLTDYTQRNWESVRHSVGCYKIEEEGAGLFTKIEGSHFNILGLPLLELLSYLTLRGTLPT